MEFTVGSRVALIGVGNVMVDIARWLVRDVKVAEVIAVARRGPAEVKFTKKELQSVARNLDLSVLDAEIDRVSARMRAVGQDPAAAKDFILSALDKAKESVSDTRFRFEFLSSPSRILGNTLGEVCGLEIEDTELAPRNGDTKAVRLGTKRVLDVETVIFCIGDRVDEKFGLPVKWNAFVKNPDPHYPIDSVSYEAFDPDSGQPVEGVFVAGWAREASSGLVGVARKDGELGAQALLKYLSAKDPIADPTPILEELESSLARSGKRVVSKADVQRLSEIEKAQAERLGLEDYKMKTNDEMLAVIGDE
jgi:ferredoxin--NADP+ reductase